MKITILTLFPEYFETSLTSSVLGRAIRENMVEVSVINIRDYSPNKHATTDNRPYGGGAGMVLEIEPIFNVLVELGLITPEGEKINRHSRKVIVTSAKGRMFNQTTARNWSSLEELVIVCGHYEGIDERVIQYLADTEMRIGDFVLTGGEPAALVMIDAVARLIPGVLGNSQSLENESHQEPGKLGYPVYTRPEVFKNWPVPKVLLSGNHQAIDDWREKQSTFEDSN